LRFTSNNWVGDLDKDADVEIRYGKGIWPGYTSNRLTWDSLFPVCSPELVGGDVSPENPPTKPKQLSDHTLLHVMGYEEGWAFWLNQFGYHSVDPSQGIHFDSSITMMEMAALGHGIMLGRTCLVTNILESGRLVAPFEESIASSEAFFLATPVDRYSHPDVETFRYWLISQAEGDAVSAE
jgi:LysR family glycine cleavage system transcriptional activator